MKSPESSQKISYVQPEVRSLSEQEMLELMGPAQAYAGTVPFGF